MGTRKTRWHSAWRSVLSAAHVTLVDYGIGNLQAFANIYRHLNIPVEIANTARQLDHARKLILPGVGAFDWAMKRLNGSELRDTLDRLVLEEKVPVLGVCVGMQMMAQRSEEGEAHGLGWIDAEVFRFESEQASATPLPHMGWNDVKPSNTDGLFRGVSDSRYYFLHSYYFAPKKAEEVLAVTSYGREFCAAVASGHIYGTQFHPEKSHQWGIELLRNFASL